jgi:hypothetical protein
MSTGGFVMVPDWLRRRKPSGSAMLIYITLASFGTWNPGSGTYEECRPSVPTLADETDLSENTVRKALRELLDLSALTAGGVRRDERGAQLPTVYRVVFGQVVGPGPQNLKGGGSKSEGEGVQKDTPGGVPKSEGNQEPSTKNQDTKKPSASPRGTRLPDDWKPSKDLGEWLLGKLPEGRWTQHSSAWAKHETEKFTLYWTTKTGREATKIGWDRTWQRWMLTALERYRPVVTGRADASSGQFKSAAVQNDDRAERARVKALLVDELLDRGLGVQEAQRLAEAALREREQRGETIRVDTCPVSAYIDGKTIDGTATPTREVTR